MHLILSLKNEFCFDLPMFSKYPATSINSYLYKMTLSNYFFFLFQIIDHVTEVFDSDGRVDPDKLEEWLLNHRIGI